MNFSLKNNKGQFLIRTDYGYGFIDPDRTHKHYTDNFWFGFWECLVIIWNNPEDGFKICSKIKY
jgi:hypothetical protein